MQAEREENQKLRAENERLKAEVQRYKNPYGYSAPATQSPAPIPCERCDGDGKAHGSDRPFEWHGPDTYPGPCPVCNGTGLQPG